jgi:hypothetical protein
MKKNFLFTVKNIITKKDAANITAAPLNESFINTMEERHPKNNENEKYTKGLFIILWHLKYEEQYKAQA